MELILQKRGLRWKKPWDSLPFSWWHCFAALVPLVKRYLGFPVRADGDAGSPIRRSPRRVGTGCPWGAWAARSPQRGGKGVCSLELAFKRLFVPAPREITPSLVPQQLISCLLCCSPFFLRYGLKSWIWIIWSIMVVLVLYTLRTINALFWNLGNKRLIVKCCAAAL